MNVSMLRRLESYLNGTWSRGAKEGVPLLDASTGDAVALIDSTGLDFSAALAYGRETAGPALRAMTSSRTASSSINRVSAYASSGPVASSQHPPAARARRK